MLKNCFYYFMRSSNASRDLGCIRTFCYSFSDSFVLFFFADASLKHFVMVTQFVLFSSRYALACVQLRVFNSFDRVYRVRPLLSRCHWMRRWCLLCCFLWACFRTGRSVKFERSARVLRCAAWMKRARSAAAGRRARQLSRSRETRLIEKERARRDDLAVHHHDADALSRWAVAMSYFSFIIFKPPHCHHQLLEWILRLFSFSFFKWCPLYLL